MGGNISYDFRQTVVHCTKNAVGVEQADIWRVLFRTDMSNDDIGAFCPVADLRLMRQQQPLTFASFLYVCSRQIACFVDRVVETDSSSAPTDSTAVLNAVRMLAVALPVSYETMKARRDQADNDTSACGGTTFNPSQFWIHGVCGDWRVPSLVAGLKTFSTDSTSTRFAELVEVLLRVAQLPGFTVEGSDVSVHRRLAQQQQQHDRSAFNASTLSYCTPVVGVDNGAPAAPQPHASTAALRHRYEVLRLLLGVFSFPAVTGVSVSTDPLIAPYTATIFGSPWLRTLLWSLSNYSITYVARGTLPYTSHIGAELPEAVLANALGVLNVLSSLHATAVLTTSTTTDNARNEFACFLSWFDAHESDAARLMHGLLELYEIPLYSRETVLKGSQRVVECAEEVNSLLWTLQSGETSQVWFYAALRASSKLLQRFVECLLFVIHDGISSRSQFTAMHCASMMLLRLTEQQEWFVPALLNGKPTTYFTAEFPNLRSADATLVDAVVTVACDLMSPSVPLWCHPLLEQASCVISNVLPAATALNESTCFEVFQLIDYVTSAAFLAPRLKTAPGSGRREAILNRCQNTLLILCDAVVQFAALNGRAAIPLVASFAAAQDSEIAQRLKHYAAGGTIVSPATLDVDKTALKVDQGDDAESVAASSSAVVWPEASRHALPVDLFEHLTRLSREVLQASSASVPDMYSALAGQVGRFVPTASGGPRTRVVRRVTTTADLRRWALATTWSQVHRRHIRPPLFDRFSTQLIAVS